MARCSSCGSEVPAGQRFCGSCGGRLGDPTYDETRTSLGDYSGTTPARSAPDGARFAPGAMVAGRYRISGLLGRGGMGEVYRADDLKLGQAVALKFLPPDLERDPGRRERFLTEVRLARTVSHPNVCRVYDVGETEDGAGSGPAQHFLSMEFVDGEDLASLLRRIGRLPQDKAIQVARQTCAGLAAAHAQGILHRDLKPANVMIDGRGRAKITDFGLAVLSESLDGGQVADGTPGYMAPEQLAGREVTVRSDIYALGLVLYELFTGKKAFEASSRAELRRLQESSTPATPSSHVSGLDPAIERSILRCLEREPDQRLSSALAVATALPGGDPLAAALEAGETPSPEMVAAAGGQGGVQPLVGLGALLFILAGLVAIAALGGTFKLIGRIDLPLQPAALVAEAQEILEEIGYTTKPADEAHGFRVDREYLNWVASTERDVARWDRVATVRPAPIRFWYRQASSALVAQRPPFHVTFDDPRAADYEMVRVELDPEGQLQELLVVPPRIPPDSEEAQDPAEVDWSPLFDRAGLDPTTMTEVAPRLSILVPSDRRRAWTGHYTEVPDQELRVEARALGGQPVYFEIFPPWYEHTETAGSSSANPGTIAIGAVIGLAILVIGGAIVLARRNLRLLRGDRRGAKVVAVSLIAAFLTWWVLRAHHSGWSSIVPFLQWLAQATLTAGVMWLIYLALEPHVRRLWPEVLISWSRLVAGRFRDPRLGRDILAGGVAYVVITVLEFLHEIAPPWFGIAPRPPQVNTLDALTGTRQTLSLYFGEVATVFSAPLFFLMAILLLRLLLRREWAALAGFALIAALTTLGGAESVPLTYSIGLITWTLVGTLMVRYGFVSVMVMFLFSALDQNFPLTTDLSAWYAGRSVVAMLVFAAIAAYGFWISLAGRPLFGRDPDLA